MTTRILFVCLGNICRSPAAEGVVRELAGDLASDPGLQLDSAGTGDWHIGHPPHPPMQAAARRRGYDLSRQRARQLAAADFDAFDLIVAMDAENLRNIEALRGGSDTPVRLFTDYAEGPEDHVPDPYFTGDYDGALALIERCARGLLRDIAP
ncbi:low molecular weight protein-tyrosine-phosphatase [Marinovum sp.]|uniref:low molecular weight protein-tyrosine-phosphatase n=1 Tax=Marinovum sp. TaxID=2024839 RepID=UPI002B26BD45|nr:low molecular weight protein-tyrosine-phosphatase [Marinovum sp.]